MQRRRRRTVIATAALALAAGVTVATGVTAAAPEATKPTTRPATQSADPRSLSSDQLLGQMLRPGPGGQPRPLQPIVDAPAVDRTSGPGAVKPQAPAVATMREGTYLPERVGRLAKSADGSRAEFVFESDGQAMKDPPLIIHPNLKLMMMENMVAGSNKDLRFRVSGVITEYRGRNYILIEKVTVPPEQTTQF